MDLIIAGEVPVATDATAYRIMGIEPQKISHIHGEYEKGLGNIDLIEILGERIENVIHIFKR